MKTSLRIPLIFVLCILLTGCGIFRNRFDEEQTTVDTTTDAETFSIDNNTTSNVEVTDVPQPETTQTNTGSQTAIIGTQAVSPSALELQKIAKLEQVVEKIQAENTALKETLNSLENAPVSNQDIVKRSESQQLTFKQCGNFTAFQSFDWHKKLLSLLEKQKFPLQSSTELSYLTVDDITSSCYSENGEIFVFIVPQGEDTYDIIRYDIKINSAQVAAYKTQHDGNMAVAKTFAKRNGNAIGLQASRTDNGCKRDITYGYNFVLNELHTKQVCRKCSGEVRECADY